MNVDLKEMWREILSQIQLSISMTHFKAWFSNSFLKELDETSVTIAVKNKIAKEYLENEFYEIVKEAIEKSVGKGKKINVIVEKRIVKENLLQKDVPPLFEGEKNLEILEEADFQKQYKEALSLLGLNPKYTFDEFIVGSSNRLAHAAAYAVAQNPGYAYNPLFIYGDVGLGKTHLIQAIANHLLLNDPTYKIVYSPSELFLNEMVSAIRSGNGELFRKKYREKNLLIIDDIQFIESKKGTQEEIFHTFNSMYQFNKQIVIVSDRPPEDMPFLEARLRSRFEGGMVVDVNKPEYETRLAILQKKAEEKRYRIMPEVLEFIAANYTSSIRELEGVLLKLGSLNSISQETITMTDASRILGPKINKKLSRLKPNDIISAVCDNFDISSKELKSPIRTDRVAKTRQVAMYLLRTKLNLSYLEVAHMLNRKDHTTVIHAVEKIQSLQLLDEDLRYKIQEIAKALER